MCGALQKLLYVGLLVVSVQGLLACQPVSNDPDIPLVVATSNVAVSKSRPIITDEWAVRLQAGTDPDALAQEYGAKLLKPIGSLKDTWLIQRPGFDLPDNSDPLRQDKRVLWLERQIKHKVYHRPSESEKSYIK